MGIDGKYGRVTTERGTIREDEPVVVFRAQDALLPMLLLEYRRLCEAAGSPPRHIDLIDDTREDIIKWQAENFHHVPRSRLLEIWDQEREA